MSESQIQLKSWLTELGSQQGAHFTLNDEDRCSIKANDKTNIIIHGPSGHDHFYINIELTPIAAGDNESLFRSALNLNLFQQETQGCTIALDEKSSMLVLCYRGEYQTTSFQEFSNILNNMIDMSGKLIDQLEESTQQVQVHSADVPAMGILC